MAKLTEATVQAELYHQLRNLDINCVLEYKLKHSFIDIAIMDNDIPILAIEVKKTKRSIEKRSKTKQYKKYTELGIPFIYCQGFEDINKTLKAAETISAIGHGYEIKNDLNF